MLVKCPESDFRGLNAYTITVQMGPCQELIVKAKLYLSMILLQ